MPIEVLFPKYKRDPNAKIEALYSGVANGWRTVTTVVQPSQDKNSLEASRSYGPGMPRGQGGRVAVLVLGGMETTLDEMEYILEERQQTPFVPRYTGGEIAAMCRQLQERRNEQREAAMKHLQANPSEAPRKRKVVVYLPVGCRFVPTSEPGLEVLMRV